MNKVSFILVLLTAGALTACGQEKSTASTEPEKTEVASGEALLVNHNDQSSFVEPLPKETEAATPGESDAMKEKFGESCISEQTFSVELSEYGGKVYFVPYAPSENNPDFYIQIVQDDEVLTEVRAYVPEALTGKVFTSLDAVSFYDVNYDGSTDIVLITTYGDTSFASVYYGFDAAADDYDRYFIPQEQLSENISNQLQTLSVSEIRRLLADGKKNGEFTGYQEAYQAVSRLCELESTADITYNLICFDDDDIPELAAGVNGYYTSLYTYHDGNVYTLMDRWPYGAMGNAGYEYSPGRNSLRNYNTDYAGAILYTTYMTVSDQYAMETVAQIQTFNFDDVNENGIPDEDEEGSLGNYSISYIDGAEADAEKCASYNVGEYEYIETTMSLDALNSALNRK